MTYRLGKHSWGELMGVHPDLVRVVERAIELTAQDFTVHDGLRTKEEQREYVRRGVSQTMFSRHLPQPDGFGHAVDLVPYINGKLRWEWDPIYRIAEAVRRASDELDVRIRWGGCWHTLTGTSEDPEVLVRRYADLRRRRGLRAFTDGPHYQLEL